MTEQTQPTMKHHVITASISAGIILSVLFLFWFTFKVIPSVFSNGSNFVATTLSSTFIPATTTTNTVVEQPTTNPATTQTSNTNNVSSPRPVYTASKYYYGKPDLAVRFIASGVIDPATKQFITTNYAGENDTVAIKFEVRNIGTNISGAWNLRLNMPSKTTPYFDSGYQRSINPGDRIEFVTSFERPASQGVNLAYITADPLNLLDESAEANNSLTVPLNIQGTTYNYNSNYNYGSAVYGATLPYGTLYTWTNINGNCYANPSNTYPGNMTTWYVTASGGNGYYSYQWSGTDALSGNSSVVNKTYYSSGTKTASVIITSNGQSITKFCNVNVF